jgi:hypothetical protein
LSPVHRRPIGTPRPDEPREENARRVDELPASPASVVVRRVRKAVTAMTTEQHAWASAQAAPAVARRSSPTVCGCGQDLDVCAGRHCPRCGATLHHVVAAA